MFVGPRAPATQQVRLGQHAAHDYDPLGDHKEHPELVDLVLDGDPNTSWHTESYNNGNLAKAGVGIYLDAAPEVKATKLEILTNVGLPRTMPYFFASLKVAVTQAFVGTVIAETVASNRGIGNLMMIASSSFDVPLVFAGLLVLAVLGVALYVIFSFIEDRVTGWALRKDEFAMG